MIKIVGKSVRVVEIDGLSIDELAGNAASNEDTLSVARVVVSKPTSEPWLTLHYDEWICVLKGKVEMHYYVDNEEKVLTVMGGETCFVPEGQRFRPIFPIGGTEYIPVCIPAFKPERCIREEDGVSDVTKKLQKLHSGKSKVSDVVSTEATSTTTPTSEYPFEKLYHMCQKSRWEDALSNKTAYFPPSYVEDGYFTHATAVAGRLIQTANYFYTATKGDWICIEMNLSALTNLGIRVQFEEPKPVGDAEVSDDWKEWACPHIFAGIPGHVDGVVITTYPMTRDANTGAFLGIEGVTN